MNHLKFLALLLFVSTSSVSLYSGQNEGLAVALSIRSTHQHITPENLSNYFKAINTSDNDVFENSKGSFTDEQITGLVKHGNSLFEVNNLFKKCALRIPRPTTGKDAIKAGVIAGGVTLLGITAWQKTQRSGLVESSLATIAELGLGGMAGASIIVGLGYYLLGDEIRLITSFRGNLKKTLQELKETKELVNELKDQQEKLEAATTHGIQVTEEMLKQFPCVKSVAGDNARLASIMQMLVKQAEQQQTAIAQLIALLPEEQSSEFKDLMSQTFTEEMQGKADALKKYNRKRLFHRVHSFTKIPTQWLTDNGFANLIEKTEETN